MKEEDKKLLLIDLCARLPFKPHVYIKDGNVDIDIDIVLNGTYIYEWLTFPSCQNITITPYLRPMSSMTEKERNEWMEITHAQEWLIIRNLDKATDWLNKNMFDYRGLIPMGLALEAKKGMYKNE